MGHDRSDVQQRSEVTSCPHRTWMADQGHRRRRIVQHWDHDPFDDVASEEGSKHVDVLALRQAEVVDVRRHLQVGHGSDPLRLLGADGSLPICGGEHLEVAGAPISPPTVELVEHRLGGEPVADE